MTVPTVRLNDGNLIPQIGIGTWPLNDDEIVPVLRTAVDAGYRHIDTAAAYGNETGVGRAIVETGVARDELFVTTKIPNDAHGLDLTPAALDASLAKLGIEYADLVLIHWPMPEVDRYVDAWKALIALKEAGKARSIGVSNFRPAHLERLFAETGVDPAVNQIEVNPVVRHNKLRRFNEGHGIATESWSPLGPGTDLVRDPRLQPIADRYGKSIGQVILRWHLDLGLIVIPKSATPSRIAENIDVFDFTLDTGDMAIIAEFDQGFDAAYEPRLAGDVSV
jgi:2,5-diketo-D-gluconate reductase A